MSLFAWRFAAALCVASLPGLTFANQGTLPIVEPGGHTFQVAGMNNLGQVVGRVFDGVQTPIISQQFTGHAFMWDGTMHYLPDLGLGGYAQGINDNGDIIGTSMLYDPATNTRSSHLVRFTSGGAIDLGVGSVNLFTSNLTNSGDFGYIRSTSGTHSFIRNLYSGTEREIAANLSSASVIEINANGWAIGNSGPLQWYDNGGGAINMFTLTPPNPPRTYINGQITTLGENNEIAGTLFGTPVSGTDFTEWFLYNPTVGSQFLPDNTIISDFNSAGDYSGANRIVPSLSPIQAIFWHNGVPQTVSSMMGPGPVVPTNAVFLNDNNQMVLQNSNLDYFFFDPAFVTNFDPTVVITGLGTFAYNGSSRTATAVAKGFNNVILSPAPTITYTPGGSTAPTLPGTYQVLASYEGDVVQKYNPASATGTITITKLNSTTTATGGTFAYDGNPHSATYVVKNNLGVVMPGAVATITYTPGGTSIPVTPGTYSAVVSFAGDDIYNPSSGSATVKINNPAPTVAVTGGNFTYNGNSRPATATVTDSLTGQTISSPAPTITYTPGGSTAPKNAGTYQVTANFAGNVNYPAASGTGSIVIAQADTSVSVIGGTFTYDGNAHAATATAHDDSNNVNLSGATITYTPGGSTAPVNAGTYQVSASYAGDANHKSSSGTGTIVIGQANTSVSVAAGTFAYDGNAHAATATVKNAANNVAVPGAVVSITYAPGGSNAPTTPGTYQVTAQFAGDANYNPSTGTDSITITNPPPTVTVTGGTFDYTGGFHNATATVTDTVTGAEIGFASITYTPGGHTGPTNAGTYSVEAFFEAEGSYASATGYGTIVINPVGTSVSVTGGTFSYNGNAHPATVVVSASNGSSMSGVLADITYSPGGSSAPTMPGTYQVSASYAGDINHNPSSGTGTIVITQPLPNVNVTGGTFPYNGTAHPATVSITDAATNQPIPGAFATITYYPGGSNPPVTPGTYSYTASFAGNANYPAASSSGTIVVNKADLYVSANNITKALNGPVPSLSGSVSGVVSGDGISATYTTTATQSSPIGSYPVMPVLSDPQGKLSYYNVYSSNGTLLVVYGGNTGILQPINADGTSVFKQKSTVPAKFRVYDANGNSVCAPGTVVSFYIVQTVNGTVTSVVNEAVDSTTPDDQFRCDGTQWIFNINTKNLSANVTYYFQVTLADGSTVNFHFGLR